ncbi:MAG: DUF1287 domain-containing protein [Eubacteriales bacterium]|nr:DUF1287 domain-containing protein [Bacillota bacterium]MBV1727584.1 DUF1287 domain-containing protein [Desulforudis sp.]MDZ4043351.1 DUF1287 domain-containing protein [Eubacteriales bacterium]MBU4532829.1 DUF1287 domain-containing protein [Bacillota bacterium]MBU4553974.1 DUF1287 domain-containing protein [Bacillota bacterium]
MTPGTTRCSLLFGILALLVCVVALSGCGPLTGVEVEVPNHYSPEDRNHNGKPDSLDMVEAARAEVTKGTRYDAAYYSEGYPPDGRGACTDIIWVALGGAGIDLKALVDEDIRQFTSDYPRVGLVPEPSIDFRRVPNLVVFFGKYGMTLTTEIIPGDPENLIHWQPGDIVVWDGPEHIGIVSDRRRADGVPLAIHNSGPQASENATLLSWPGEITHHFRYPAWTVDQ